MQWLFIHQDFPGQYIHIVRALLERGDKVVGIGQSSTWPDRAIRFLSYAIDGPSAGTHPYLHDIDRAVRNGLAVATLCEKLKGEGFTPDAVVGHNGWGEILFVKDVWQSVPLLGYFEFFYHPAGTDADFDPEFEPLPDLPMRLRSRNAVNLMGLEAVDAGQTPTQWQRDQYPRAYRDRIHIVHEGVDSDVVMPDRSARLWLKGRSFGQSDQVITYSARNLEPYRGFHVFMRSLPKLLCELPDAHVLVVGGDDVSYGALPINGLDWRRTMLAEIEGQIDPERVHFLGRLNFSQYLAVLQISSVHFYLTYPFILSWSLIEALSAGCLVIGSRTAPVEEVLVHGVNGYLTDFFDSEGMAQLAVELVRTGRHEAVRAAARQTVLDRYALKCCLPAYLSLLDDLTARQTRYA